MSVLPKSATGFTDPIYWKNFFAQRKSPFEWYGDYSSLSTVLEKYIKPSDKFLQIGCGNSELASQLYDNGFRTIHSIDVEATVISDQKRRNVQRSSLTFEQGDAKKLDAENESYSVVLDKGTLDALLPPNATDEEQSNVRKMFDEVNRVLQSSGRYLIVTLAQPHLIDFWIGYFYPKKQFILRTQKIENKASGFPMPVFVLIATKLKIAMPVNLPLEIWRSNASKPDRISNGEELKEAIIAEQEMAQFINLCSKKLENEVSIEFQGGDTSSEPRYRLFVLDDQSVKQFENFAAFIVPTGRDTEWMFTTPKGRQSLRAQCKRDRLVVILLNRNHNYIDLNHVKEEIGHFVSMLDIRPPPKNGVFDILSTGSVDVKKTIASGKSEINGNWTVEEVLVDESLSRRLIFLNTMNLTQSEAYMKTGKKHRKVVDLDTLACEFHIMMIAGMSLSPLQPLSRNDVNLKMAVLGVGGGLLTAFLLKTFKKSTVTGVELDADVVKIATDYFSFPHSDSRLQIQVLDALIFLKTVADSISENDKYDVIFVDVAGNQSAALQCPPPSFVEAEALENLKKSVKTNGLVALNLVTRDDEVAKKVKEDVRKHFENVVVFSSYDDVNEVLICMKTPCEKDPNPSKLANQTRKEIPNYEEIIKAIHRIQKS